MAAGSHASTRKQRSERNSDCAVSGKTENEGNSVVPTIGFEYHVIERFSIGAELGVER